MISPDSGRQWRSPVCLCLSRIPDLARPILAYYGILARKLLLHQRCLRDTDNQNDRVDGSPGDGDIQGVGGVCGLTFSSVDTAGDGYQGLHFKRVQTRAGELYLPL